MNEEQPEGIIQIPMAPTVEYAFADDTWDEQRLLKMISAPIEESYTLDYKAGPALRKNDSRAISEVTKDVSAMANSAGGTIIYGIGEFREDARKHLPEKLVPVDRNEIPREWLEHILSRIRPKISELRIHCVQLSSGLNHVAYVVEIPQGTTAHQNTDLRYYRRYNFESVAMQDHEIRDVMNRRVTPQIHINARLVVYPRPDSDGSCGALILEVQNKSDVFVRHYLVTLNVPMKVHGHLVRYEQTDHMGPTDAGETYFINLSNRFGSPLFPRSTAQYNLKFKWAGEMSPMPKKFLEEVRYRAFADSMLPAKGVFNMDEIDQSQKSNNLNK